LTSLEVHERSVDGDILLLELKELLVKHPTIKVVLMSATINHETFVKYFYDAPLLTIPGFTYSVTDMSVICFYLSVHTSHHGIDRYLEDIMLSISYRPAFAKQGKRQDDSEERAIRESHIAQGLDEQTALAIRNISRSDRVDYQVSAQPDNQVYTFKLSPPPPAACGSRHQSHSINSAEKRRDLGVSAGGTGNQAVHRCDLRCGVSSRH